jgi:MFS family permease
LVFSTGPLLQFTFRVFLQPVSEALHADRGQVSLALLTALCLSGVLAPAVGRLVDRFGVPRISVPAISLFALAIA